MNNGAEDVGARYDEVKERIAAAASRSGRSPESIYLVAVTKNATPAQVRILHRKGHCDFGESRMQHFVRMASQIDDFRSRQRELHGNLDLPESIRWHFIGHLQRNKVRRVLGAARLVHSIDSLKLAEEVHAVHQGDAPAAEILVQVNVSSERGKFGVAPAAAGHLVDQVRTMLGVRVRGLMCMAPLSEDADAARPVFTRARELFDDIRKSTGDSTFDLLSMGMSNDYEAAIECGANVVRVGTAIFGNAAAEVVDEASMKGGPLTEDEIGEACC
jgi:pyridoxal phosphate enzyme (YggS family)